LIAPLISNVRRSDYPMLPSVIGHRGAAASAPENTLAGLRRAKALGCAWVEFDVRLTSDGALVLCHNSTLDRTTTGSGRVSAQSLAMIRQCDAGGWFGPAFAGENVPTLEEALGLAAELDLGANIELKADRGREYATGAAVSATLRRLDGRLPPVLASSFQPWALDPLRKLVPRVPRGILFRIVPRGWAEMALRLDCAVIGADHRHLRPRRITEIRAAGYQLAAYTVNNPARARLLFEWGVTSVFSDAPDIVFMVNAGYRSARQTSAASYSDSVGDPAARQGAIH
jgi:glycerophosphoryl diester phosphodiesterase